MSFLLVRDVCRSWESLASGDAFFADCMMNVVSNVYVVRMDVDGM